MTAPDLTRAEVEALTAYLAHKNPHKLGVSHGTHDRLARQLLRCMDEKRAMAMSELSALGQAQEAHQAQLAAEQRVATLEAENVRLRDALAKAANRLNWCIGLIPQDNARDKAEAWPDEASAALQGGQSQPRRTPAPISEKDATDE